MEHILVEKEQHHSVQELETLTMWSFDEWPQAATACGQDFKFTNTNYMYEAANLLTKNEWKDVLYPFQHFVRLYLWGNEMRE